MVIGFSQELELGVWDDIAVNNENNAFLEITNVSLGYFLCGHSQHHGAGVINPTVSPHYAQALLQELCVH